MANETWAIKIEEEEKQITINALTQQKNALEQEKQAQADTILQLKATQEKNLMEWANEKELRETSQKLAEEYKQKINVIETEMKEHKAIREENEQLLAQIKE